MHPFGQRIQRPQLPACEGYHAETSDALWAVRQRPLERTWHVPDHQRRRSFQR